MKLLSSTIHQKTYIINNGQDVDKRDKTKKLGRGIGEKTYPINHTDFVFRIAGKNKYDRVRPNFFAERIRMMRVWIDNPFLTPTSIYMSGLIDFAYNVYKRDGELNKQNLAYIIDAFNYREHKVNEKTGVKDWKSEIWKLREEIENGFEALGYEFVSCNHCRIQ